MKTRLKGTAEKPGDKSVSGSSFASPSDYKPRLSHKSFISSVSRKLGQWYPFLRGDGVSTRSKDQIKHKRARRHSIS